MKFVAKYSTFTLFSHMCYLDDIMEVGTFGVWFTGVLLDWTQNDWGYAFFLIAGINVFGAVAFLLLFDSKREFD